MSDTTPKHRPIRSFVLREGRFTTGQRNAYERCWPRFGVDYPAVGLLDFACLFGNNNPIYLEIGFGNGEALAKMAARHSERNYLGIEVHRPGVGHLMIRLEEEGLQNVRVMRHDAMEVLSNCLPESSLSGIMLFFPDPWHKTRHHKRRIVKPTFTNILARLVKSGGSIHMATDWEDYANQMMTVLSASADFRNSIGYGQFVLRPEDRPLTKFEQRGHRLGHGVWDLVFEKL
ncbi:tRNA (guanine(46)-N(7))-methyltransferase [hydrothermal vent metagenome]|uniref:tRNA (guanine(46)-N(7))-methyltransferase n=1 Tax=hydrothermal vent metagenome TaxID=652676 RepID=A0A3B1B3Y3_9ZZZZ